MRELGLSGTSALHCHRVVREALHHAVKWDLIGRNVADAVNAPRSTTGKARIATKEELAKIVEAADETPFSALIRLTLWTGMRLARYSASAGRTSIWAIGGFRSSRPTARTA